MTESSTPSELLTRLRDAGTALLALRGPLVAGEPWPLSPDYGTGPEASWGPREVLAHVDEMLAYWTAQLSDVLAGEPAAPTPFGRVATDQHRLDRIDAARHRPAGELLDEIDAGLVAATAFVGACSAADLARVGLHPSRGELTVADSLDRFVVSHLAEHVEQLRAILTARSG
jgi:DinB family protein